MKIKKRCIFCNAETNLTVSDEGLSMYNSGVPVQRAFPELNKFDREVIISGMCYDCQEKTFNTPTEEHRAAWGENIGDCLCCGAPLWSIRNKSGDNYICPCCGCSHEYSDGVLSEVDELYNEDDDSELIVGVCLGGSSYPSGKIRCTTIKFDGSEDDVNKWHLFRDIIISNVESENSKNDNSAYVFRLFICNYNNLDDLESQSGITTTSDLEQVLEDFAGINRYYVFKDSLVDTDLMKYSFSDLVNASNSIE